MVTMQESTATVQCALLQSELKRHYYVTPMNFLELNGLFVRLLKSRNTDTETSINRYEKRSGDAGGVEGEGRGNEEDHHRAGAQAEGGQRRDRTADQNGGEGEGRRGREEVGLCERGGAVQPQPGRGPGS
jgi:hypothetical protein